MQRSLRYTVALAVIAGCMVPSASSGKDRTAEIQQTLEERASAVERRDKSQFLSTIDPSQQDFVKAQQRWFEGFTSVPVTDYTLKVDLEESPEFTRERDRRRYGTTDVVVAGVEERYRITGYDKDPAYYDTVFTFVKRGDRWLIASDNDLEDLGVANEKDLWDQGVVRTTATEHFLMIFHPDQAALAESIGGAAEEALRDVPRAWTAPWDTKVPVLVPSTQQELSEMLGGDLDVSNYVAFASASLDRDVPGGWKVTGSRVVVNPAKFARSGFSFRATLAHELTHVATRQYTGPFMPIFVEEGLAQLAEGLSTSAVRARVRGGNFDKRLPRDWEFTSGSGPDIYHSYQESISLIDFLRQRYGLEAVGRFYTELGKRRLEPGTSRFHLDAVLRAMFDRSLDQLEAEWAAQVSKG